MIPSEYGSSRSHLREVVTQEIGDDEAAALEDLRPVERAREQLQLRELHRLVDPAEDALHVRSRLDELRREAQRLRRRVRVLEAARVGDERRRRAARRSRGVISTSSSAKMSRTTSAVDDASGDDQVHVAEARVVVMVVDVEHELRALEHGRLGADPRLVRAVDREQDALLERRPAARAAGRRAARNPYSAGQRRRARELPSPRPCRAARAPRRVASSEPSASPSGFSWS